MRKIILLLCGIVLFSCSESDNNSTIPKMPVNLELDLGDLFLDSELNRSLAFKIYTQPRFPSDKLGFGGIIVINGSLNNQVNLYAYDLSCPVEAQNNVRIIPNHHYSATTASCPTCGSVFNISDGTGAPQSGTKLYLKSYKVTGSGTQYTVTN